MTLIIACGLKREARIIAAARRDVVTVVGGGIADRLERRLGDAATSADIILSCGIAGALIPSLRPGDIVLDGDQALVERFSRALSTAVIGHVAGSDTIVATASAKRALATRDKAVAADMESHVAARVARVAGLPFVAIRAIADEADDDLPPAALVGMRPDGGMALAAVLASLARQPGQLPALLRIGRQAGVAFRSLEQALKTALPGL